MSDVTIFNGHPMKLKLRYGRMKDLKPGRFFYNEKFGFLKVIEVPQVKFSGTQGEFRVQDTFGSLHTLPTRLFLSTRPCNYYIKG